MTPPNTSLRGAKYVPRSCDSKLSPVVHSPSERSFRGYSINPGPHGVAATYVSIERTCPSSCPFKAKGCYAASGFTRVLGKRLDAGAEQETALGVIRAEVELLDKAHRYGVPQDGARGGRDLRLHIGGETPSTAAARLLAGSAARWRMRGGGAVWTYTHNWASIPRASFGSISTLASVESPWQAQLARSLGYVPAVVVPSFPNGAKAFEYGRVKAVPCPAEVQPGKVTCSSCRLCMDDERLRSKGLGIAFSVHGKEARTAAAQIATPTLEAA